MDRRVTLKYFVYAFIVAAVLAGCVRPVGAARNPRVDRVRYSVEGIRTRVVLDLNRGCKYNVTTHRNPERIAINIPHAAAGKSLKAISFSKGAVDQVRVNRLSWGVQIVLDLEERATWKDFKLPKNNQYPDRIVLDVFSSGGGARTPSSSASNAGEDADREYIIAIDPGHGGKDPGAKGHYGLVEKKLVLDIARKTVERINQLDGFKAVLTRNKDVYLTLPTRTAIADRKGADVFVSIHMNSAPNSSARGAEVYFLSPGGAKYTASKMLSNPGRAASELGLDNAENSDLLYMLVDVNQQSVMARSEKLAETILKSLDKKSLSPIRTVKQKSFAVLRTIVMPSVLVETGFLTNKRDAKLVRNESGRQKIADAIANGIVSYFSECPPPRGTGKPAVVVHKVRKGESLWEISRQYGTSIASLRKMNKLRNSSVLRVGQELIVTNRY